MVLTPFLIQASRFPVDKPPPKPLRTSHRIIAGALFLSSILALDAVIGLGIRNGWVAANAAQKSSGRLPYTPEIDPLTSYTGIHALDSYLWGMLVVYWTAARAAVVGNPALSVLAVYIAGQLLATHTLVMVEGSRRGNRGRWTAYSTFWGMAGQNFVWGATQPLWCAVSMIYSPIARLTASPASTTPAESAELLTPDADQIRSLPWAMLAGYVIPTVMACLPWPRLSTPEAQQVWIVIWVAFPVWVRLAQTFLPSILSKPTTTDRRATQLVRSLRRTYALATIISGLLHVAVVAYVALPHLRPQALSPVLDDGNSVTLKSVFVPMAPWSGKQADSLAEGLRQVLVYDWYFACGATLLWAAAMLSGARVVSWGVACGKALVYAVLLGPAAAAVALIWERDERRLLPLMGENVAAEKGRTFI